MKDKFYEYVVLEHPTKEEYEKGTRSKVLVDLTKRLAKDEKTLSTLIARQLPEAVLDKLEQVEIIIRPF